jgi:hypothetical protein
LNILQVLEQLEKEVQLNNERENLLDIEKKLLFMINEKIEAKMRKNQALRLEVEKQKTTCLKLARILNTSIKESYSIPW